VASASDGDLHDQRLRLIRELRQQLESLRRAGIDRIPAPVILPLARPADVGGAVRPAAVVSPPYAPAPEPVVPPRQVVPTPVPAAEKPAGSLFDEPVIDLPPVALEDRPAALAALAAEVAVCTRCPVLAATRTRTVFGVGSPTARLMFIGEAPGADEDRQGVPFVGRAGMLLTDMITKGMGLTRDEVYIANVLKSRPPENRNPEPEEVAHCLPYLERQIEIIRPEFLCLLGKVAASALLDTALPLARLRGRWHRYRGIPTAVTYHPSYLLRTPGDKIKAWEDLQMIMKAMGIARPSRKKE
jgi:uracil-DNA glycosylase family 4